MKTVDTNTALPYITSVGSGAAWPLFFLFSLRAKR